MPPCAGVHLYLTPRGLTPAWPWRSRGQFDKLFLFIDKTGKVRWIWKAKVRRFLKGPKETNSRTANPVPVMRTSIPCDHILNLLSLQVSCSHCREPVFKNRDFPLHVPCSTLYGIAVHVYKFYMASNDPSVKCPPWFWRALASLVLHPEWRQGPASTRKSSKMSPRHRLVVTATRRAATIRSIRHWRDYDRYIEIVAARAARAPPMRAACTMTENKSEQEPPICQERHVPKLEAREVNGARLALTPLEPIQP